MGKIDFKKVLFVILIAFYLLIGIATIVFAFSNREKTGIFCGITILVTSIIHVLLYFLEDGYKNSEKAFYLVLGIIGLSLGIVVLANKALDIQKICFFWGLLEIVRGSLEIKQSILDLKTNKIELLSLIIALGNVVLGILLCIHESNGITAHLAYLGVALILSAIKYILDRIIEVKKQKNQINSFDKK